MTPFFIVLEFLVFSFTLLWGISKGAFNRYRKLSDRFPLAPERALPLKWISISPDFGKMEGSRNGVNFSADREGFYLHIFWLFRFGLKPAFIPWEKVSIRSGKSLKIFHTYIFSFHDFPEIEMTWYERDWKRVQKKFSEVWPESVLQAIKSET